MASAYSQLSEEQRAYRIRYASDWNKAHREEANRWHKVGKDRRKIEVLTHYGKDGKLQCCWDGCDVVDPDMLTIDHVNNDGAEEKKKLANNDLYIKLRRDFPTGYQTLCCNHNWKKEVMRRRGN